MLLSSFGILVVFVLRLILLFGPSRLLILWLVALIFNCPRLNRNITEHLHSILNIDIILSRNLIDLLEIWSYIINLTKLNEEWHVVVQLPVCLVVVPGDDWQCVFRLEQIGNG